PATPAWPSRVHASSPQPWKPVVQTDSETCKHSPRPACGLCWIPSSRRNGRLTHACRAKLNFVGCETPISIGRTASTRVFGGGSIEAHRAWGDGEPRRSLVAGGCHALTSVRLRLLRRDPGGVRLVVPLGVKGGCGMIRRNQKQACYVVGDHGNGVGRGREN